MVSPRYEALQAELQKYPSFLVAFSGGVDSSLLLYAAAEALGRDRVLAVTAVSAAHPGRERGEAAAFCREQGVTLRLVESDMLSVINAHGNGADRCYHCKHGLFSRLAGLARAEGYAAVGEGSNLDDDGDFRPGRRALAELGIVSPLKAAGLAKADVRTLARESGLRCWDKPSAACLVSRFPYGVTIASGDLARVDRAEDFIRSLGFRQCRVRHYGTRARLEVEASRVAEAAAAQDRIGEFFKGLGYEEVEIDPRGYRSGSMNVFD